MPREPRRYQDTAEITFFGKRLHVIDLSHELGPGIPVYPGHMKVAMWDHMTHAESRLRLGNSPFKGYAVKGISLCDHDSTHMDAIYHFNGDRPDLTIDTFAIEDSFLEAVWIDLSHCLPRTSITIDDVKRAMDAAKIDRLPEGGAVLYFTGAAKKWEHPLEFVSSYAGLDEAASRWILDQGVRNVLTDAVSTDNPADLSYPNHRMHAEYLVNHTEVVHNIDRIPRHAGFSIMLIPLRFIGATGSPVRIFALWEA